MEENTHAAKQRCTSSSGVCAGSVSEAADTMDREKWSFSLGRQALTPTHERSLTTRISAQSLMDRLTTPEHQGQRSAVMSVASEGSSPADKSPAVSSEQQGLRSPNSSGSKRASTGSGAPLLVVTHEEEMAAGLRHATTSDNHLEGKTPMRVSLVPVHKADQNGYESHIDTAETRFVGDAEEQQEHSARKLSVELHRVDTIRTTTECALVSFGETRSSSPDSVDPTTLPAMDTHSTGSSSLDLTIVTSGSDGMREEVCETTETDSRLSSAAGNRTRLIVRPATATAGSMEGQRKGGQHVKTKIHRFFSSDTLDDHRDGSGNTRSNPLKRLFNFHHPLWRRSKAKSLPSYCHDNNLKSPKDSAKVLPSQSNQKSKSDLDSPIAGGAVDTVVMHGPTWV